MIGTAYAAEGSEHAEAFYQDPTFWVGVAFVIFVALAGRTVWRALAKLLDERSHKIEASLAEAERLRHEAEAALADYQKKQRQAVKDAQAIVEQAKVEAERMKVHGEEELRKQLALREKQAIDRIAQAEQRALADVRNTAVDVAIAATRAMLKDGIDAAKAKGLIDDAIVQLPKKMN